MRGEANRVANLPTCPCQYSAANLGDFSSLIDSRTKLSVKPVKTNAGEGGEKQNGMIK